jgi:hypothetical protein
MLIELNLGFIGWGSDQPAGVRSLRRFIDMRLDCAFVGRVKHFLGLRRPCEQQEEGKYRD